jgi:hypothetical protein
LARSVGRVCEGQLDATVDKENQKMGTGAIIRDFEGEVLATLLALKYYIIDPIIAETTATWRAVLFCKDLGYQ